MIEDTRVYFTFKEVELDEDNGQEYLITPHSNPYQYETPIDFVWNTKEEARAWVANDAEDWGLEEEEVSAWVLVKVTEEVISQVCYTNPIFTQTHTRWQPMRRETTTQPGRSTNMVECDLFQPIWLTSVVGCG